MSDNECEGSSKRKLTMSFDPKTIEHLGINMYSSLPNALAELVANAYDADARAVYINLTDKEGQKSVEVVDDGCGMDFDEINDKFLRIGRNRRKDGAKTSPSGRKATGKKGLGKLALFGLCDVIDIETVKESSGEKTKFTLNRNAINAAHGHAYEPEFRIVTDAKDKGTTIKLQNLKRKSAFDKEELADSLARLFDCFDTNFRCYISFNGDEDIEVDNKRKFKNIDGQFSWSLPEFSKDIKLDYLHKREIKGKIISAKTPLKAGLRGIILFANGRLVNAAEFFGIPTSSHVFSYLAGWLDVDFVDDIPEDVIATNRQSLNWDNPALEGLRQFLEQILRKVIADWRDKRKEANKNEAMKAANIDEERWLNTQSERTRPLVKEIMTIASNPDDEEKEKGKLLRFVHDNVLREYAEYHLHYLHPLIIRASEQAYRGEDYYGACFHAVTCYTQKIRECVDFPDSSDVNLIGRYFGYEENERTTGKLSVTEKYKSSDDIILDKDTKKGIEDGHKCLSEGMIRAFRNPLAHKVPYNLRKSKLLTDLDCLDALSLLSHLFRRLDDAIEVYNSEKMARDTGSDKQT